MKKLLLAALLSLVAFGAHAANGIETWSTTAASNNAGVPYGWPVGMNPSDVKLSARQMMTSVRNWYDDAQWIDGGYGIQYVSSTGLKLTGDRTAIFQVNRRVKAYDSSTYVYGTIVSSSYASPSTTVIITPDSGTLNSNLARVWYGAVSASNSSVTSGTLGLGTITQIVSGSTKVVANTDTISFTTAGSTNASVNASGVLIGAGVSSTALTSLTDAYISGKLSVGTTVSGSAVTVSGTVSTTTLQANTVGATTVSASTVSATTIVGNGLGMAKAWFKMGGSGSCSLNGSYNIASCTRTGTGNYGVSFTTPMADANYAASCTGRGGTTTAVLVVFSGETGLPTPATTGFNFSTVGAFNYTKQDSADIQCVVFGN